MTASPTTESPPPTRGSTVVCPGDGCAACVSPAHAGIDRLRARAAGAPLRLPRPRGDRPPRLWFGVHRLRVSPAHAGIDRQSATHPGPLAGLPRPRGDRPHVGRQVHPVVASPPPTRGSTEAWNHDHDTVRVSPAHAGIDLSTSARRRSASGLPRPRGDRPHEGAGVTDLRRSPPPTRGSTGPAGGPLTRVDVSPAHAGIDRRQRAERREERRLPRPRGDRPSAWTRSPHRATSPPPTRGSTGWRSSGARRMAVSPAHAGIDLRRE